jgi:hypothetical protein
MIAFLDAYQNKLLKRQSYLHFFSSKIPGLCRPHEGFGVKAPLDMHALKEKSYLDQRGAQSAVLVLRSGKPALQHSPSVSAYLRT